MRIYTPKQLDKMLQREVKRAQRRAKKQRRLAKKDAILCVNDGLVRRLEWINLGPLLPYFVPADLEEEITKRGWNYEWHPTSWNFIKVCRR